MGIRKADRDGSYRLTQMSAADDAARFWEEYEECRAQAAKAASSSAAEQWLLFAEEWLKRAQGLQRDDAGTSTASAPTDPSKVASVGGQEERALIPASGSAPR